MLSVNVFGEISYGSIYIRKKYKETTLKGFEVEMFCLVSLSEHDNIFIVSVQLGVNEKNLPDKEFLDTRSDLIRKVTLHLIACVQVNWQINVSIFNRKAHWTLVT